MKFNHLLKLVDDEPVFESSLLLAGDVDPMQVRLQLTRWVRSGHVLQLRRGLYAIAPPYQKQQPHPFMIANRLQRASYVSLQSALAYYGLIPEMVTIITSVSTGRPERLSTPLGLFDFRHIKPDLLFGYQMLDMGGQNTLVAVPEKALLDLVYLQPGVNTSTYFHELRLQNIDRIDLDLLNDYSKRFTASRLHKVPELVASLLRDEKEEYVVL
jgi:predicted transcriptional regulator of viral defense system